MHAVIRREGHWWQGTCSLGPNLTPSAAACATACAWWSAAFVGSTSSRSSIPSGLAQGSGIEHQQRETSTCICLTPNMDQCVQRRLEGKVINSFHFRGCHDRARHEHLTPAAELVEGLR